MPLLKQQGPIYCILCLARGKVLVMVKEYSCIFVCSTSFFHVTAACMTWELAESGKDFITTIINGSDLVPTFSTASIDDLRSEVYKSSF